MDQYSEWDRFTEILEESRTYEQAIKRYRNERRAMRTAETLREKAKLERDERRDAEAISRSMDNGTEKGIP